MRVAIDALPINNFSGRHVLLGHLRNLASSEGGNIEIHVFHHAGNADLCQDLGSNVYWHQCDSVGASWWRRIPWQWFRMQSRLHSVGADVLLSTSGAIVPGVRVPQLVLAQNPWCFFPAFHGSAGDRLKAWLQRRGYRMAQRRAEAVFYLSNYLGRAYRENAGVPPKHGETLYVGVDESLSGDQSGVPGFAERDAAIVTVSVMTPHKAIEDVVDAFALIRSRGVEATLRLVGPWADQGYRRMIEGRIEALGLGANVEITGKVGAAELAGHYRRARVFCLLSRCESFGIPAVEAQLVGTPCVVADACAPPEVAGPGGTVVPLADLNAAANALQVLLTDRDSWTEASGRALANVERFRWSRVSEPLIRYLAQRGSAA